MQAMSTLLADSSGDKMSGVHTVAIFHRFPSTLAQLTANMLPWKCGYYQTSLISVTMVMAAP